MMTNKKIEAIIDKYQRQPSMLVSVLQDVQAELNYLPKEALVEVASGLGLPHSRVFAVATFYRAFSLKPRGRHLVNVCLGTACHVRGAVNLVEQVERELGVNRGETTPDMKFTLETVNCLGCCALGPVVVVDGEYFGQMKTDKVEALLKKYN